MNTGSPYRIPAPPPPGPTWWEHNRSRVISIATGSAILAGFGLFVTCLTVTKEGNVAAKANALRAFETRIAECPIIEIDHGLHSKDPIMVLLDCKTYRERRRVPPGYRLP